MLCIDLWSDCNLIYSTYCCLVGRSSTSEETERGDLSVLLDMVITKFSIELGPPAIART